jgi:hypothetical protein
MSWREVKKRRKGMEKIKKKLYNTLRGRLRCKRKLIAIISYTIRFSFYTRYSKQRQCNKISSLVLSIFGFQKKNQNKKKRRQQDHQYLFRCSREWIVNTSLALITSIIFGYFTSYLRLLLMVSRLILWWIFIPDGMTALG